MPFDIKKLDLFPTAPGVYVMKNSHGAVLYVGKAINLRQRVKQYFSPGGDGRLMVPFLVAKVEEIETLVVTSEKEALLLENTLIKQHRPKYNALLKDDKTYIALKLTTKHPWPRLQLVRYKDKPAPDGVYFGPYTSAHSARQTFDLLSKIFPMRQCTDQEFARRTRPCILYDMKRCIAPCVNRCTKEEYQQLVDRTVKFLRGKDKDVLKELYSELDQAAAQLEFERAGEILKTIRQIENTIEHQNVDRPFGNDIDAIGIFRQGEEVVLCQLFFRDGKLIGSRVNHFANIAQDDEELLESFLLQNYEKQEDLPKEILLPVDLKDTSVIEEILFSQRRRAVRILVPVRGEKRALVEMARVNAETSFKKEKDVQAIREKTLLEMQERFHLQRYPKRIECFDNSNTSGSELVSALIVFTEGQKDTSRYRKFKIRTVEGPDDYGAMQEVLMRRYKRAKEENNLPDLIIVDGGKGHLNIALQVLRELNIITIDVIGLAKEEGRHDRGMTHEQVFLPNIKDPIILRKTSPILFLLQQIRDEAHRFALAFHRQRRTKKTLKSAMDDIPGIGPVKRQRLLKYFGSVKKLREASAEELQKVPGISGANIETIIAYFRTS